MKEAISRLLEAMFDDSVIKKLNWTGQGERGKRSFRDLTSRKVLESKLIMLIMIMQHKGCFVENCMS